MKNNCHILGGLFDFDNLKESIAINEQKMADDTFWNDQTNAQKIIEATNYMREKVDKYQTLSSALADAKTAVELYNMEPENDMLMEITAEVEKLKNEFNDYELHLLLSGKYDDHNALLEIHSGAGGTEAMDWANMLFRMYQRWCDSHNLTFEVDDFQVGDEAGLKSVSVRVQGNN
ncbi:MAG: PCRF domain-containing protein, partial [Lactobacillus iners]|nr:PCRF domain-containing protein [Lactobacillus iners]